jgi:hypothetical protein
METANVVDKEALIIFSIDGYNLYFVPFQYVRNVLLSLDAIFIAITCFIRMKRAFINYTKWSQNKCKSITALQRVGCILYIHTYHYCFIPKGVAEVSQIFF